METRPSSPSYRSRLNLTDGSSRSRNRKLVHASGGNLAGALYPSKAMRMDLRTTISRRPAFHKHRQGRGITRTDELCVPLCLLLAMDMRVRHGVARTAGQFQAVHKLALHVLARGIFLCCWNVFNAARLLGGAQRSELAGSCPAQVRRDWRLSDWGRIWVTSQKRVVSPEASVGRVARSALMLLYPWSMLR